MATALATLGEDVTLIVRPQKLAEQPRNLSLEYPGGTTTATVKTASRVSEPVDALWIATKTYQLEDALPQIEVVPSVIIPLLNGTDHIPLLRARFGHDRVVPGTIAVGADRIAPGKFIQHSIVRLGIATSGEPLLKDVVDKLRGLGWTCNFVASETMLLWTKLCFLEPFALVTSASGKNNGEILADPEWRARFEAAIQEACAVAAKEGALVDGSKGSAVFENLPPTMRASMAKDLAAGRPLELDGIAGPILRGGHQYGVPTPVTASLVAMIEAAVHPA